MINLKDKTAIITGGAGQLGRAISRECASNGANVVVVDINKETGSEVVRDIIDGTGNKNVVYHSCDITNRDDTAGLMEGTLDEFGSIDVLINNAYPRNANYGRKFEDVSFDDFCENVDMHLGGYFLITREAAGVMKKQMKGSIINIASIYGIMGPDFRVYEGTPMTMPVEYSAIKGGIVNLTRYLATYLAKYNIRVNAISPGGIFNDQPESFVTEYCKRVPLGRMGRPEDITGAIVFLSSDASSYITGHNLVIDGGWSIW